METKNSLLTSANRESLEDVKTFFNEFIESHSLDIILSGKLQIIADEIYSNIINYSGASYAKIEASADDECLYIAFEDDGAEFNPLEIEEPDTTLSAEERKIGGLGMFIVKNMSKDIKYYRTENKNILKIDLGLNQ